MDAAIQKRLNSYALAAGCLLLSKQEVNGQVVYTDIEPDLIVDHDLYAAEIDMNDDGVYDFFFHNNSFVFYDTSWLSFRTMQNILVGPDEVGNALAGISVSFSTGYGEFTRFYPFALDQGSLVGDLQTWQTVETQVMALRVLSTSGDIVGFGFYAWYEYLSETIDNYLGVRFNDLEGASHYGWIRCDILEEGRILVIKDYAYEAELEYPIVTGDTSHYVAINENVNALKPIIFTQSNTLTVNLNTWENPADISVFDLSGKLVFHSEITENYSSFSLSVAEGIYLVTLRSGMATFKKKILI